MKIPYYQISAFANSAFSGNPAGVCLLDQWLDDDTLQAIAAENNLSATAFIVNRGNLFDQRWFTPTVEIDLCGQATLASALVVFNYVNKSQTSVKFSTRSGELVVKKEGDLFVMDFPSRPAMPCDKPAERLVVGLGEEPKEILRAERDYLVIYDNEDIVINLEPDMKELSRLDRFGVIVSAPGQSSDFVSRFFAPKAGVPEDPATGSAHSSLVPYWANRLNKKRVHAVQVSRRGGELFCEDQGVRVQIAGKAVVYLEGTITI